MADLNAIDEQSHIGRARRIIGWITELVRDQLPEPFHNLGCGLKAHGRELPLEMIDLDCKAGLLRGDIAQFSCDLWVVRLARATSYQLDDIGALAVQ